jgi:hypothetical protein
MSRYSSDYFYSVVIDTSASIYSIVGYGQFQVLQHLDSIVQLDTFTKGSVKTRFGIDTSSFIRFVKVIILISEVEFYVIYIKTPFLLYLVNMDKLGVYFNNLQNLLITKTSSILVIQCFSHPFFL